MDARHLLITRDPVMLRLLPRRSFSLSHCQAMRVIPLPVREDNYAYLLVDETSNKAAAVDPYDVPKITATAKELGVQIVAALTTHHHFDHSGGNKVAFIYLCNKAASDPRFNLGFRVLVPWITRVGPEDMFSGCQVS